ncbi:hypothetical protein ACSBR2_019047 [Camellia fascicularis]
MRNLRPCSSDSSKPSNVQTVISCFVAATAVSFVSLAYFISLDMKQFHMLSFTEEEVMNAIKKENLISKGGSGNVYKKLDSGDRRSCRSSSAMIRKGNLQLLEYDAEVATLSSIRHVNVVKLYYCITSKDWNLRVLAQWEFVGQVTHVSKD